MIIRAPRNAGRQRSGVVLLAVLIAIVVLSLAAYQFSDRTLAEYQAADNAHRLVQARAFADSGIHMTAAILANPDNVDSMLGGNPYDNATAFKDVAIAAAQGGGPGGTFTLIAPPDPDNNANPTSNRYGVTDEGGKININAFILRDPSGDLLFNALMTLPNMVDETAAAIVDWVDTDNTPRQNGAENDYYSGLSPAYQCKNGPLDSLDELLLVRGVTRDLLYGTDLNRNGIQDPEEAALGDFDRGWSAFLTVHSIEPNTDPQGNLLPWINDPDISTLYATLSPELGDDLAKYIILFRQYGSANASGQTQSLGQSIASLLGARPASANSSTAVNGSLGDAQLDFTKSTQKKINSLYDLINTQVSVPSNVRGKPSTLYSSPLNDASQLPDLLGKLFQYTTLFENAAVPARINVNTAPKEVLAAIPGLKDADVQAIVQARANQTFASTGAWLLTDANLTLSTLQSIDKYVTTRTQVFRIQSIGAFADGTGPTARIEAVVDANNGRPRIVAWKDWTQFGKTKLPN